MWVIKVEATGFYDVPEIFDFDCEKFAFLDLGRDARMFQTFQYIFNVFNMFIDSVSSR